MNVFRKSINLGTARVELHLDRGWNQSTHVRSVVQSTDTHCSLGISGSRISADVRKTRYFPFILFVPPVSLSENIDEFGRLITHRQLDTF